MSVIKENAVLGAFWVHLGSRWGQEIREQTLQEMQDISSALIAAETRIGEILLSIPKNTSYHGNQHQEVTSNGVENTKNKSEVTEEKGYSKDQFNNVKKDL